MSDNGRRFYGGRVAEGGTQKTMRLIRAKTEVEESAPLDDTKVVPFWLGKELDFRLAAP